MKMVMFPARKMKILGEKHLRQWRPMGLILKIVSDFYHFDNVGIIIGTFYPTYILHFTDCWNGLLFQIWFMENETVYKTSCTANQLIGCYMRATLALNGLSTISLILVSLFYVLLLVLLPWLLYYCYYYFR